MVDSDGETQCQTTQQQKKALTASQPATMKAPTVPAPSQQQQQQQQQQANSEDLVLETRSGQVLKLGMLLARQMKQHQRDGVQFMWSVLAAGGGNAQRGCILADEMGLGKTMSAISIASGLLRHSRVTGVKKAIVVCPSSLVRNWAAEVRKWCGSALASRMVVVSKTGAAAAQQPTVHDCVHTCHCVTRLYKAVNNCAKDFKIGSDQRYALLIISYETFRIHASIINAAAGLGLLICDEGHRLKSSDSTKTMKALEACPATKRLMITGTPVQNNLEELYALANFVHPGVLGERNHFRDYYARPIEAARDKHALKDDRVLAQDRRDQLSKLVHIMLIARYIMLRGATHTILCNAVSIGCLHYGNVICMQLHDC
eukprot:1572-Heterococcus_DN1.PRE.1